MINIEPLFNVKFEISVQVHRNFWQSCMNLIIQYDPFLPAAKRHGHAELWAEKEKIGHFCFFGRCFCVLWYLNVLLKAFMKFMIISKNFYESTTISKS